MRPLLRGKHRVVIALIEHFGDIVACEPIVRHVRERHPDARITFVVNRKYRSLVDHHPAVDEVVECETLSRWMAARPAARTCYDLHLHERWCDPTGNVFWKPDGGHGVTRKNYYEHGSLLAAHCRGAGLPVLADPPQLHAAASDAAAVDALDLPQDFIVMHCRSNQVTRDWQDERWRALAGRMDLPVLEVGLRSVLGGEAGRLCGELSLLETYEVIRRASLFVGIDSGPAHFANAAGVPGVILLGHYSGYTRYTPYSGSYGDGSNASLIHHDGPARDIPLETVLDQVAQRLARREAA